LTIEWWNAHVPNYEVFVSELVLEEAGRGDSEAAEKRCAAIAQFDVLRVTAEALELARVYLERLPLPSTAAADAVHLALASINGMDYLLTWNCRHIARGSIIRSIPVVNSEFGYKSPTICTPEELLYENPENMD
jgi:predicted nucleic acid-binding protein